MLQLGAIPPPRRGATRAIRVCGGGGGVPLWSDDRVMGGIGVSGGTVEQDIACANAALEIWRARRPPQ